ncbi:MAG: exodeoxyribonuclease III [Alphaproteobacteria bacterium]|nr:exodeoxyribonuclease III [Alphaproteobacteria bacterium]
MSLRVATWNVNSIRTRLEHAKAWINAKNPDVICLQETKVVNEDFPLSFFEALGYHCHIHGQKSYNGVAFISKRPMENIQQGFPDGDLNGQARVIRGECDGVSIINLYVPQGESVDSEKFIFKEAFYGKVMEMLQSEYDASQDVLLCGDMNIAPAAIDVYDVEKVGVRCMFTPEEHGWLDSIKNWGMVDTFREMYPEDGGFSWWDYRANSFARNKGWRIDHIYVTSSLFTKTEDVAVDKGPRGVERPSDHVPVYIDLNVG